MNKRQFFHTCSPNCVISSIQLNSFCCQSEGPVTSFIILQEGTEVVINVWDWCRHTHTCAPIIKCYSQRSYFSYKTATAWVIVVTDVSYGFGFSGCFLLMSFTWTATILHFSEYAIFTTGFGPSSWGTGSRSAHSFLSLKHKSTSVNNLDANCQNNIILATNVVVGKAT